MPMIEQLYLLPLPYDIDEILKFEQCITRFNMKTNINFKYYMGYEAKSTDIGKEDNLTVLIM
jgi:hypothetical protein